MIKPKKILMIALGNSYRSDDGFGPSVLQSLRTLYPDSYDYLEHNGDPADLVEIWQQRDVIIIDALQSSNGIPGTIYQLQPFQEELPNFTRSLSSHALSLVEAIQLARLLQKLPRELTIFGVEGQSFQQGLGLSPVVLGVCDDVIQIIQQHSLNRDSTYA